MDEADVRKLDYEQTVAYIHKLADIRFKLLMLLPVVTGSAVGLLKPNMEPWPALVLGFVGTLVTLGIIVYDQHNSQIYGKMIHRAKLLEDDLGFYKMDKDGDSPGGVFNERARSGLKMLFVFRIKHDRGLAVIYATVFAAWIYLFTSALLSILEWHRILETEVSWRTLLALGVTLVFWIMMWVSLVRLDGRRYRDSGKPTGEG